MTINLTGMNNHNEINLTGKTTSSANSNSIKINQLKKYILTNYVIPLYTEQWDILNNNKLLLDGTISQINTYYRLYKLEELNLFLELLKVLKILITKNELVTDLEERAKKIYDKNNIINMVYKTTKIRILPEYEIYNTILGKPTKKDPYKPAIITDIKLLMDKPNITYDKIHEYIIRKYT